MNAFERGLAALMGGRSAREPPKASNAVTPEGIGLSLTSIRTDQDAAMKLSTVSRCIDILSDSLGKMPFFVYDSVSRQRVPDHDILPLLAIRPNRLQSAFVFRKQMEAERVCNGNGIAWIQRDPRSLKPTALFPIPSGFWTVQQLSDGSLRYTVQHPFENRSIVCGETDVLHVMAFTKNGYRGIGYLERAQEIVRTAKAAQEYSASYYLNGGQPAGILRTESDLSGTVTVTDADGTQRTISKKDRMREEWAKRQGGPDNAGKVAVLDMGLDYKPLSISNRDAQFVEQSALSVEDLARVFGVPLYKLQAGKQSYSSNEQNAIEYVVGTLHPNAVIWEQELSYKLLTPQDLARGLRIRGNLMNELRGDFQSRGTWYQTMRDNGSFSVNDIRELEDMPDVDGGDEHYASLNYVPLQDWRELSRERAEKNAGGGEEQ